MKKQIFYKYVDLLYSEGVKVWLEEYIVIKETPGGHWIILKEEDPWNSDPPKKWWVSKHSRKRRAYPNKALALESFILRKKSQIRILENQLDQAKKAFNEGIRLLYEKEPRKKHKMILDKMSTPVFNNISII